MNNALKFTPSNGHVQLIASQVGNMARLDAKDNGAGIAPENLDHVFDLFGQAEKQHVSHNREGLGIGLSLVRQLTEAQRGTVEVSSAGVGTGCTFTVYLPLANTKDEPQSPTQVEESSGRLSGLTILLVDDSPVAGRLARRFMTGTPVSIIGGVEMGRSAGEGDCRGHPGVRRAASGAVDLESGDYR